MVRRVYISDEAYKRIRKFMAEYGMKQQESLDCIILEGISESGRRTSPSLHLDPEVADVLQSWARELGYTESELVERMMYTVSTLFDTRLSLADVLRSIPELRRLLAEKKKRRKPIS